jgi:hypothetical protein
MSRSRNALMVVAVAAVLTGLRLASPISAEGQQEKAILDFFTQYDAAFVAKDLDRLEKRSARTDRRGRAASRPTCSSVRTGRGSSATRTHPPGVRDRIHKWACISSVQ